MSGEVNQIALCHAWHKKAKIGTDDQHHVGGPFEGFTDQSNVDDSTQAEAPKEYDGNGRVCHVHCH